MDEKHSLKFCPKCGEPAIPQGNFCMSCGSRYPETILPPTDQEEPEMEQPPVEEPLREEEDIVSVPSPAQPLLTVEHGLDFLNLLRERFSTILIVLGALAIIAAISFSLLVLLPEEFISDIEIPPIEGLVFDFFVIIGVIAVITKEGTVFLGYIPKKGTLDRWFSFVLLLICWVNLVTFSLALVEMSIFLVVGFSFQLIFIFLSTIIVLLSILYFGRFKEPIFSIVFSIAIMSVLYLVQWIVPIDPLWFTFLIYISTILMLIIARFDNIPFIGTKILLPIMFMSPYLLSNSITIAILFLLVSFPIIDAFLKRFVLKESDINNFAIQSIGDIFSPLGLITVCLSVFYGHLDVIISFFLLLIPVIGLIGLKTVQPSLRINVGRDLALVVYLAFITAFFDLIISNLLVLAGISFLLIVHSSLTFFEYRGISQNNFREYAAILLLVSLIVVSLTKIDFLLKNYLIIVPLAVLLVLIVKRNVVETKIVQSVVFGTEILLIPSFIRTPFLDWFIIPGLGVFAILGLLTLFIFNKTNRQGQYSLDLVIFTLLFEIVLLGISLGMRNLSEMLIPVFILIVLVGILSSLQVFRKLSSEFLWVNASFVVCFGIMTFWNEFDPLWTVLISIVLILPILLEIPLMKGIQKSKAVDIFTKNFNLNFSISAIGLSLIAFFEEMDPIGHSLLFFTVTFAWVLLYISGKQSNLGILTITTIPGLIFLFELLLNQTLFTPITETTYYLYPILLITIFPSVIFQIENKFREKEEEEVTITPFVLGTAVIVLVLTVAFMVYSFEPEEYYLLIFGIIIAILVSTLLIKWQYESIILILISIAPPILLLNYLEFSPLVFYLLPILPILVNLLIGMQNLNTSLSIRLHEILLLIYISLFIFFDPVQLYEFSIALASLFLISWQFLTGMKKRVDQDAFILTNFLNSALVLGLVFFIDPLAPETNLTYNGITFSLTTIILNSILALITLTVVIQFINMQISSINSKLSFLLIINLVFNSSSIVLSMISLLTGISDFYIETIVFFILIGSIILLFVSMLLYSKIGLIKPQITIACIYTTTVWMLISSLYFSNMELIFLWMFIAPLLIIAYITKQERSIALLGLLVYFVAGIRLIENILDFVIMETTNWLTILGLILFGIELVTLGIYASLTKRPRENNQSTEIS
ncbi:MAG: hypothetical protein ACFFAJ_13465 [Candidatus Hodarchaeota archaeon]